MMMKLDSNHTSLAVISLDSALNKDENIIHKNIIHYKSVNTLKKRSLDTLLMTQKVLLMILMIMMKNRCFLMNT